MNIQVGDRVTYKSFVGKETEVISKDEDVYIFLENIKKGYIEILKIERPKYEVVEEKKKELLTNEEKESLKVMIEHISKFSYLKPEKISTYRYNDKSNLVVRFYNKDLIIGELITTCEFKNIEELARYTLKELGLE